MKHWTLCLGVMNMFWSGGERLAVFQPSNIQPSFTHSLCSKPMCYIWNLSNILVVSIFTYFPKYSRERENLKVGVFFPLCILLSLVTLPFYTLLYRDDWCLVSGKPVATSSCFPSIFSGLQSEEKSLKLLEKGSLALAHQQPCIWGANKIQIHCTDCAVKKDL